MALNNEKPSSSLPKVLFHNPASFIGGAEVGLLNCLSVLRNVIEPVVLLPNEGLLTEELRRRKIKVEIVELPQSLARVSRLGNKFLSLLRGAPALPIYLKQLQDVIVKQEPALLYSNGLKSHFLLSLLAKWNGIPLLCHVRDVLGAVPGLHYLLHNVAQAVVTNSKATLDALSLPSAKAFIIPNAIDLVTWDQEALKEPPAIVEMVKTKGQRLIVSAGKLVPLKGFAYLIKALAQLPKDDFKLHLAIAGSEDYATQEGHAEELQELIKELDLQSRVTLLGNVSPLAPLLKNAHLFVLASKSEGFGRVVAEAMASRCPVIASNVGGLKELVEDGERGLLFEVGNVKELSEKMALLLADDEKRKSLVLNGRTYVERELTLGKLKDRLIGVLEPLLPSLDRFEK